MASLIQTSARRLIPHFPFCLFNVLISLKSSSKDHAATFMGMLTSGTGKSQFSINSHLTFTKKKSSTATHPFDFEPTKVHFHSLQFFFFFILATITSN